MGGDLRVESTPGAGSTFAFAVRLDTLSAQADAPAKSPATITGYAGPRRRVLVVDDVGVNRAVLVELLQPLGFELREAPDGAAALRLAPAFEPHLVFLDLRMPGIDGLELARRLRATGGGERLKLIAMSASVLSFSRDDAFAAGCDDFLPKPFHEQELLDRLATHLGLTWTSTDSAATTRASAIEPPVSPETLASLLAIARRGEVAKLRERLTALRGTHPAFAAEAGALLQAYRMEDLRALLDARLTGRGS
jgi:CheY-like chemotaxis protein